MREMKDSGVEWIGEIPDDWEVGKTLFALSMAITDGPHETPELLAEGIPFVSAEAVSCGNGTVDFSHIRGFISEEFYEECCKKYIPQINDIYMIKSGATTGKVAIVEIDDIFTIWSPLAVFRCNPESFYCKYLFYFLQSDAYQKQLENKWSYGTQQNIGMRTLEKLFVCFPSLLAQHRIADYLDAKCAQIDRAIARQQEVIEKLKEYKLSVITEAVTKGLNPDVPMKDSGIEWIGQIPEYWEISKVKYVAQLQPKCSFENISPETPITYAPMECIKQGYFISNETSFGELSTSLNAFEEGDIVLAKVTPCFENGNVAIMAGIKSGIGLGSSELFVFRPTEINTKYLLYWLQNDFFKQMGCATMTGTGGLKRVSPYFIANCEIHLPPRREQEAIVEGLDKVCLSIDKATAQKLSIIDKLTEYKKSLIYEVVTGKREV